MNIVHYDCFRRSREIIVYVPTSCHHSFILVSHVEQGNSQWKAGPGQGCPRGPSLSWWQLRKSDAPAGTQAEREANEIQGATSAKQY